MKHSTPWREELDANDESVISGYSARIRTNGEEWTTFAPETSLDVVVNLVDLPEWIRRLVHRSSDILKACRKSKPNIGLAT